MGMAGKQAWWWDATCRDYSPRVFDIGSRASERRIARAKAVCARCPVTGSCLAEALREEREFPVYGIRGGTTPDERKAITGNRRALR
jgi:WhiB family redox-sensing transcriptional regulator